MKKNKPLIGFFLYLGGIIFSQEGLIDYNDYYQYPLSLGVEYQGLQIIDSNTSDYSLVDIVFDLRYPLPQNPSWQPFFKSGFINFDSKDQDFPDKWDHYHVYGLLGLGYSNRFAKNFEVGVDIQAGLGEAVFPQAVEIGPVGSVYMYAGTSARISLNPSYSFSIDIRPSIRYQSSLQNFNKYDGFMIGLGFGANFRFGEDPDSASSIIRNIRFDNLLINPVFGAMQSYYAENPVGQVTLTNTSRNVLTEVDISFFQAGFMDSATPSKKLNQISPGESVNIDLLALYNQQIFTTNGITPLNGEVQVSYRIKGRPVEEKESVSYDLYDKTSITWDDDRKVGAFITPADSALQNYVSFIRKASKEFTLAHFSEPLQLAMQVYYALDEIGMIYQIDPVSPFARVQEDSFVVDSVKLSRDTLSRSTGDCDDLTVLFCSLLEAAGIETGFITVPGHIYPVINTGYSSRKYHELNPDRDMTIDVDGELWIPIEITMVGRGSFLESWKRGSDLWKNYDENSTQRGFYRTRSAQSVYRPVGLRENDLGLQYGNSNEFTSQFDRSLTQLAKSITSQYEANARRDGDKTEYNRAGIAYAKFGLYREAELALKKALEQDPEYISAQVNLGNIAYMKKSFSQAYTNFDKVYQILQKMGKGESLTAAKILINMSKALYAQNNNDEAQKTFNKAQLLNPELATKYAYLGSSSGTTRASDSSQDNEILFLEE